MSQDPAAVRFARVTKRYADGREALSEVSFAVMPGEFACCVGPSGAGKTTTLKLVPAIERPTAGAVIVNGQNVGALRATAVPYLRRRLGLVFQDHRLLHDRNVFENAMLPLAVCGAPARETMRRVRAALDKVGLEGREKSLPVTLSGGEQQRLCIARAVVNRPSILIADEPTANLDEAAAAEIMTLFHSFNQVGVTILIATHDPRLERFASQIIRLERGRVVADPIAAGGQAP